MRGGPAVLLARSEQSKPGSVTGVSRARLMLEIIAVYELFGIWNLIVVVNCRLKVNLRTGCLASCQQPTLLSTQGWW